MGAEISSQELKEALAFPQGWGPSEWGPMPYLPDPNTLVQRMESQWGDLDSYRGLNTSAKGARGNAETPHLLSISRMLDCDVIMAVAK